MSSQTVYLKCVEEGSKLRVRIISPGFFGDANCQFPRALRASNRYFSVPVSSISLARMGSRYVYRVKAPITTLDRAPTRAQIRRSHRSSDETTTSGASSSTTTTSSSSSVASKKKKKESVVVKQPEKIYDNEEDTDCVICMDAIKSIVLVPCGHYCLCEDCSVKLEILTIGDRKCPMCRTVIEHCIKPSQVS